MKVSVIIPTLNEEEHLGATLNRLVLNSVRPHEIIVADAGSTDHTREIVVRRRNCTLVECKRTGRASQMNRGAELASGDILCFLHADCLLPRDAIERMQTVTARPGVVGGGFARRFDHPSHLVNTAAVLSDVRGYTSGLFFGDQSLFCKKAAFQKVGGFSDVAVFEDFGLCQKLRKLGKTVLLRPPVLASGRRFGAHPVRTVACDALLTAKYLLR